jgi:hypothetical protein
MSISGLSTIINKNTQLENVEFFYVSKDKKIIHWYDIFTYHFININNQTYIYNYSFSVVMEYFFTHEIIFPQKKNMIELDKAIFITNYESNVGHMLNYIIQYINYIIDNNLTDYKIVITQDIINISPHFIKSIIYLFFDYENVIIIDDNTLVKCNITQIIILNQVCDFHDYTNLITKLKSQINTVDTHIYDNVCLLKLDITKNTNPINKTFNIEYIHFLENKGFTTIIPENYNIIELFNILYNSKNVIMSWGCCSYLNSLFINPVANVLLLCHSGYKHEWTSMTEQQIFNSRWIPNVCNKKLILYDLPTELTDSVKNNLNIEINKFNH